MIIKVTEKNIRQGFRNSSYSCPVALALRETTGLEIRVTSKELRVAYVRTSIPTPPIVFRFLEDFDLDRPVQPFEFEIPDAWPLV